MFCARCKAPISISGGAPFTDGPYKDGYWCDDCWTVHYDSHPEELADRATIEYIHLKAKEIRVKQQIGLEVLFEEGASKVYLTDRGTFMFAITPMDGGGASDEYDPGRLGVLQRALEAIKREFPSP